jgi:UDP-GlcNAc:undecaprenyl-phosphate GlcNAc-1-phosphate transferase
MHLLILYTIIAFNILFILNYKIIAKTINAYDCPDLKRKIHKKITPILGGVIIILTIIILNIFLILKKNLGEIYFRDKIYFLSFFFPCYIFFIIGIIDDKFSINPYLKFILSAITILTVINLDSSLIINELKIFNNYSISLGKFSIFFSVLCFLLFINALNLFDGINLQVGLYSIFALIFLISKNDFGNISSIIIVNLIFFLILNFNNKSFLGDSGTLVLAFIIAYLTIKTHNYKQTIDCGKIFVLMFFPGIDMLRLFVVRLINKKNPFYADKNHIHHILIDKFGFKNTTFIIQGSILLTFLLNYYLSKTFIVIFLMFVIYIGMLLISKDFKYKKLSDK